MPRRLSISIFDQRDLDRALKAVKKAAMKAGFEVVGMKICFDGSIDLRFYHPQNDNTRDGGRDQDDLDRELAEFEARNGQG